MRILRAADHKMMPWKNGGGTTTEIAVHPEGAGLDTFEWRVSMARVETDGPFSGFPGVERTLAVLEGEGIRLEIEGQKPVELTKQSRPLGFAADVKTSADLLGGPITDLNVMTRRGSWRHSVERIAATKPIHIGGDAETVVLAIVAQGSAAAQVEERAIPLGVHDCILLEAGDEDIRFDPSGPATLFLVTLLRG